MAKAASTNKKTSDTAATFRFNSDLLRKLKFIALKNNTTQTAIIEELLVDYVAKYEKKNGEVDF